MHFTRIMSEIDLQRLSAYDAGHFFILSQPSLAFKIDACTGFACFINHGHLPEKK